MRGSSLSLQEGGDPPVREAEEGRPGEGTATQPRCLRGHTHQGTARQPSMGGLRQLRWLEMGLGHLARASEVRPGQLGALVSFEAAGGCPVTRETVRLPDSIFPV